eukprot:TRINITY_DN15389_c0_g1_i2.p1 TRINITY_DN15389_c0_g1~~TRINITY_DN15389_c0_g1_i2.p1  ORF type:complete len:301 (-),score=42.90 TRINITY_DN15389_c0_g1_i2:345-1247(-)
MRLYDDGARTLVLPLDTPPPPLGSNCRQQVGLKMPLRTACSAPASAPGMQLSSYNARGQNWSSQRSAACSQDCGPSGAMMRSIIVSHTDGGMATMMAERSELCSGEPSSDAQMHSCLFQAGVEAPLPMEVASAFHRGRLGQQEEALCSSRLLERQKYASSTDSRSIEGASTSSSLRAVVSPGCHSDGHMDKDIASLASSDAASDPDDDATNNEAPKKTSGSSRKRRRFDTWFLQYEAAIRANPERFDMESLTLPGRSTRRADRALNRKFLARLQAVLSTELERRQRRVEAEGEIRLPKRS